MSMFNLEDRGGENGGTQVFLSQPTKIQSHKMESIFFWRERERERERGVNGITHLPSIFPHNNVTLISFFPFFLLPF